MSVLHFHDLFCYLEEVIRFADRNQKELGMEVFGKVDFQADVREPGFLDNF